MRMLVPRDAVYGLVEYNSPAEFSNTASTLDAVNLRFTGGGFDVSQLSQLVTGLTYPSRHGTRCV